MPLDATYRPVPAAPQNQPSPSQPRRPVGTVVHHMMGWLSSTDRMFQDGTTGYSTNLGIGTVQGVPTVHEYVPVDRVAWGNGNTYANTVAVSIEHENDPARGATSKPTADTHELSAQVHAALALRFDWRVGGVIQLVPHDRPGAYYNDAPVPGFGRDFNMITHRSLYSTQCPGELDWAWIANRGNQIIQETLNPPAAAPDLGDEEMSIIRAIQFPNGDTFTLTHGKITHHKDAAGAEKTQFVAGVPIRELGNEDLVRVLKGFGLAPAFPDWDPANIAKYLPTDGGTLTVVVVDGKAQPVKY